MKGGKGGGIILSMLWSNLISSCNNSGSLTFALSLLSRAHTSSQKSLIGDFRPENRRRAGGRGRRERERGGGGGGREQDGWMEGRVKVIYGGTLD